MAATFLQYPPLPNATTQSFIDDSGITATGNLMSDFHAALVQYCVDAGAIANTAYGEKLSQDDLWNLYVKNVVSADGDTEAGNPATAGRGRGGHVGNNPGHYYREDAQSGGRGNPNKKFPTAGYSTVQPITQFDFTTRAREYEISAGGNMGAFMWSEDGAYFLVWFGNDFRLYEASTPWDQTTLTFDSVNFFDQTTAGIPNDVWLHPDGTYWASKQSTAMNLYLMSTPYDMTTSSLVDGPTGFSGQGCQFSPDGDYVYMIAASALWRYTLSTPWDLSTAGSLDTLALNSATNKWVFSTTTANLSLSRDGLSIFIDGGESGMTGGVAWYELASAYGPPSTATFKGLLMASDSTLGTTKQHVDYSIPEGHVYVHSYGSPNRVTSFTYATQSGDPSDISTTQANQLNNFVAFSHYSTCWSQDGDYFYYHDGFSNIINNRLASTPWDASTLGAALGGKAEHGSTSVGLWVNPEGKRIFAKQSASIHWADMTTKHDISTAGAWSSHTRGGSGGFTMQKSGMGYLIANVGGSANVVQYALSTRYDPSTDGGSSTGSLDISGETTAPVGIALSSKEDYLYVMCSDGTMLYYELSTPGDVSTGTYSGVLDFSAVVGSSLSYCGFYADPGNNSTISITNFTGNDVFNFTR